MKSVLLWLMTSSISLLGVKGYSFSTNATVSQRLALHTKKGEFGDVVAMQGNIALVTEPYYSFNQFANPDGMAYVYRLDNGYWTLIRSITDLEYADEFGRSAALHTDYFAVFGAPNSAKYGTSSGVVHYTFIETNPYKSQSDVQSLVQSERHNDARFGSSVSVGEVNGVVTVAVGAPGHRGKGAVFIYTRQHDGTLGNEEIMYASQKESDSLGLAPKGFGAGVNVGDSIVAGSAPGGVRGYVYFFQRVGGSSFTATSVLTGLTTYDEDDDDPYTQKNQQQVEEFGLTLHIADNFIFVGVPYSYGSEDNSPGCGRVSIYSYSLDSDGFLEVVFSQNLEPTHLAYNGKNSFFGTSIDYCQTDKRLVVGSPYGLSLSSDIGRATLYVWDSYDEMFNLEATLQVEMYRPEANKNSGMQRQGETDRAGFGTSVAVSGQYVLVGAPQGDAHYGDAFVFKGVGPSETSFYFDLVSQNLFTTIGLILFPVVVIGFVMLILLWRKFRDSNYEDSFSDFVADEVSDFFSRVRGGSASAMDSCTSLQFGDDDDDSAHSSHPMMVGQSVVPPKKKSSKRSKTSKLRTKTTDVGSYKSANYDDDDDNL